MSRPSSPVLELQTLASEKRNDIADLLRKALMVATKLGLSEFRTWVEHELKGYPAGSEVPEYRKTKAELRLYDSMQGRHILIQLTDELYKIVCDIDIRQALGTLPDPYSAEAKEGNLQFPLPPPLLRVLIDAQGEFPKEPVRFISPTAISKVFEGVRSTILEWALRLESEGILGEGISFSQKEKEKAAESPSINIANFQGIIGNVSDSTVLQSLHMEVTAGDFDTLRRFLQSHGITEPDLDELEAAIEADPKPTERGRFGPAVSIWLGNITSKAYQGACQVSTGTIGSLIANAIWLFYEVGK